MDGGNEKRPLLQTGAGLINCTIAPFFDKFLMILFFVHTRAVDFDNLSQTGSVGSVNTTAKLDASQTSVDVKDDAREPFCNRFLPCDPRRWLHRYFMLFFMCMLSFGSYYVYDNPTALQRTIMKVSSFYLLVK